MGQDKNSFITEGEVEEERKKQTKTNQNKTHDAKAITHHLLQVDQYPVNAQAKDS